MFNKIQFKANFRLVYILSIMLCMQLGFYLKSCQGFILIITSGSNLLGRRDCWYKELYFLHWQMGSNVCSFLIPFILSWRLWKTVVDKAIHSHLDDLLLQARGWYKALDQVSILLSPCGKEWTFSFTCALLLS